MPYKAAPVRLVLLAGLLALNGSPTAAQTPSSPQDYALTIYSPADIQPLFSSALEFEPVPGYALVQHAREVDLATGRASFFVEGFPRYLDSSSLVVRLASGRVLHQHFEAGPLRGEQILERSLGRQVSVEQHVDGVTATLSGELLTAGLPLLLRTEDGSLVSINDYSRIRLPAPSTDISAQPRLNLMIDGARAGSQRLSMVYGTAGIAWRAEYIARLHPHEACRLDFSGQAHIVNRTGHGYMQARVKLASGDPKSGADAHGPAGFAAPSRDLVANAGADSVDRIHLEHTLDLPDGSSQQIALVPDQFDLPCRRDHLYIGQPLRAVKNQLPITEPRFGHSGARQVRQAISFTLAQDRVLPAGRLRLLAEDSRDGSLDHLAEYPLPRHPAGQRIDLVTAPSLGLRGRRHVREFELEDPALAMSETIEIRLHNDSDAPQPVRVREHLYRWRDWQLAEVTHAHRQVDDDSIEFDLEIPPQDHAVLRYRVRYHWTERFQ